MESLKQKINEVIDEQALEVSSQQANMQSKIDSLFKELDLLKAKLLDSQKECEALRTKLAKLLDVLAN